MELLIPVLYSLFNLSIDSGIPLPRLRPCTDAAPADLVFREGFVPERLAEPFHEGPVHQIAASEFLFEVKGTARFWGRDGRCAVFEREEGTADENIALFLLGTVLGGLLLQRGMFLLHACAVAGDAGAILIAGESGSGKSTFAAALVRKGYRLVAEDVCLLTVDQGKAWVHPGCSCIKLWKDSLDLLGISPRALSKLHPGLEKYHWPVGNSFEPAPQPVDAFFELTQGEGTGTTLSKLKGVDKLLALTNNTYRVEAVGYVGRYADCISYWADKVRYFPMFRMDVPRGAATGGLLSGVDCIETTLGKEIA